MQLDRHCQLKRIQSPQCSTDGVRSNQPVSASKITTGNEDHLESACGKVGEE